MFDVPSAAHRDAFMRTITIFSGILTVLLHAYALPHLKQINALLLYMFIAYPLRSPKLLFYKSIILYDILWKKRLLP